MRKFISYISILLLGAVLGECTRNPFSKSEVNPGEQQTVTGKVQLSDGASPSDVFVWLEEFDVATRTDSTGAFELEIPPADVQPGQGLSGVFAIYYYVANYAVETSTVVVAKGQFVYGDEDMNSKGKIRQTVVLRQLLDISTSISPATFGATETGYLYITVELDNPANIPVDIETYWDRANDLLACILLKPVDGGDNETLFTLNSIFSVTRTVTRSETWIMHLHSSDVDLEEGIYEVIPYMFIRQSDAPRELLDAVSPDAVFGKWHIDYFQIPIKWQTTRLTVTQ